MKSSLANDLIVTAQFGTKYLWIPIEFPPVNDLLMIKQSLQFHGSGFFLIMSIEDEQNQKKILAQKLLELSLV